MRPPPWTTAEPRERSAAQGHLAPVADLAVDDSGALLASASADNSVRVWDAAGGFCTHVFTGHGCAPRRPCLLAGPAAPGDGQAGASAELIRSTPGHTT